MLVLRGAGGSAFVAGTDIRQFADFESPAQDGARLRGDGSTHVLDRLEAVRKPTVALVDGFAMGSGLAISAACDLRVITPDAKFGMPIARTVGNCLSMGNYARLAQRCSAPARLKDVDVHRPHDRAPRRRSRSGFASAVVERRRGARRPSCASCSPPTRRHAVGDQGGAAPRPRTSPDGDDLVREAYGSEGFRRNVAAFGTLGRQE